MNESLKKFQSLLRELFQFDCADLDFGIYRIMNHKRDVIERFIAEDLPNAIAEELNIGALADQNQAAKELEEVAQQIKSTLATDAIDADGNLVKFQASEIGKKYEDLKKKVGGGGGRDALETVIFNHLYAFFQPLLSGRRLHLKAPLLQEPAVRHPLQWRRGPPPLGQQRPVLRQDRRALPRLFVCGTRRCGAFQTSGG